MVRGRALAGGQSHFDSRVRGLDLILRPKLDLRHLNSLFADLQMKPVFDIFGFHGRLRGKEHLVQVVEGSNPGIFSFLCLL